jgi:hypothetical protein
MQAELAPARSMPEPPQEGRFHDIDDQVASIWTNWRTAAAARASPNRRAKSIARRRTPVAHDAAAVAVRCPACRR